MGYVSLVSLLFSLCFFVVVSPKVKAIAPLPAFTSMLYETTLGYRIIKLGVISFSSNVVIEGYLLRDWPKLALDRELWREVASQC